jgi:hypothetical protein
MQGVNRRLKDVKEMLMAAQQASQTNAGLQKSWSSIDQDLRRLYLCSRQCCQKHLLQQVFALYVRF